MNKKLLIISAFSLFALAGCSIQSSTPSSESPLSGADQAPVAKMMAPTTGTIQDQLLSIVKQHATADDCMSLIDGKVYNLTPAVTTHPGGSDKIISICGKDGTSLFLGQHGDNQKVLDMIAQYEIAF